MRRSRIITLLTDFGNQDAYVGIMKGVIAGINPRANVIDICHNIPPQDVFTGAYLLSTAYIYFPKGTIHVAVVDPGVGSRRDIVCVETREYFFLVPDNGLLSFVVREERPKNIIRVTNDRYFLPAPGNTFHGRDVFAPVAAHLSMGIKPQQLGTRINRIEQLDIPWPEGTKTGQLEGRIIHIDRFGNLVTNITRAQIEQYISDQARNRAHGSGIRNRKPGVRSQTPDKSIKAHKKKMLLPYNTLETTLGKKKITGLSKTYMDVGPGEPLALFGSAGFLEVSVNQGSAREYFKVDRGDTLTMRSGKTWLRRK